MKKKVIFSIVGIALFAVAIGFRFNSNQEKTLKIKNIEALAGSEDHLMDEGGGSGGTTCYDSYSTGFWGTWTIYDCENCNQIDNVIQFTDQNNCS